MNQSNNRPAEKYSLDLCKFIMAFAVIAIHTDPLVDCSNAAMSRIGYLLLSMAVPFFFLTSGYLLACKLQYPLSNPDNFSKIRRYIIKILKMYLIWTLLYFPMALWHFIATGKTLQRAIQLYIQGFFFVGQQYNSWPLWYLLSTIYTLALLLLLLKYNAPPTIFLLVSGIAAFISFSIDALLASPDHFPTAMQALLPLIHNTVQHGRIFTGGIYLPLGMLLANRKLPVFLNRLLLPIGFIASFLIHASVINASLLIIISVSFFGIIEHFSLKKHRFYHFMRQSSMILYLIHMYVWSIYYKLLYNHKDHGIDDFLITAILAFALAVLFFLFKNKSQKITSEISSRFMY